MDIPFIFIPETATEVRCKRRLPMIFTFDVAANVVGDEIGSAFPSPTDALSCLYSSGRRSIYGVEACPHGRDAQSRPVTYFPLLKTHLGRILDSSMRHPDRETNTLHMSGGHAGGWKNEAGSGLAYFTRC
jgi:hypothetical protein